MQSDYLGGGGGSQIMIVLGSDDDTITDFNICARVLWNGINYDVIYVQPLVAIMYFMAGMPF